MSGFYAVAPAEMTPLIGTLATFCLAALASVGIVAGLVAIVYRARRGRWS